MNTLAILVHADPSVRALYLAALPAGCDLAILNAPGGGRSSAYTRLARDIANRGPGTMLEQVVRHATGQPLDRYRAVVLATFSAGYGLAREVLSASDGSARQLAGLVSIDSWHSGLVDGHASAEQLEGLVDYARRAISGEVVCWIGHSDVRTPQTGPQAFASTTQVADYLRRATELQGADATSGCLRIRAYDLRPAAQDAGEHGAALTVWGPDWLGGAVRQLDSLRPENRPTEPPPRSRWDTGVETAPLGDRICAWLGYQFGLAPREIPGALHEPMILAYSRLCRRGGRFLGMRDDGQPRWLDGVSVALPTDEAAWCAAFQSACLAATLRPNDTPPHGLRVSVRELVEDARAVGTLREPSWTPTRGSVAVYARMVGGRLRDPLKGEEGHVRAAVAWDAATYLGIGGNEGNTIQVGWHPRVDPLLRGWIER